MPASRAATRSADWAGSQRSSWAPTGAPRPSDAARVNAYQPLLARAQRCEQIRHHLPNLLAVNFYKEGDLFRVVNTLNGIS